MKWSELEAVGAGCKEHPNNKQQPGVCSSCLRDKLSKLYNTKPTSTYPLPRFPSSSSDSPQHFSSARRHRRHTSHVTDSVSSMINFNYGLKKSKSIAFAPRNRLREREVIDGDKRGSKKDSFWSKLLKLTKKDTDAFMHSRTMREGKV